MIYDLLKETFLFCPDRDAIIHNHEIITYKQLMDMVEAATEIILKSGSKTGDKIAILYADALLKVIAFFAVQKSGCVAVLLSLEMPWQEVMDGLALTQTAIILSDLDLQNRKVPAPYINIFSYESLSPRQCETRYFDESMIFFTSGTTGKPKGVVVSSKKFLGDIKINRARDPVYLLLGFQFEHSAGIGMLLQFLLNGSCILLMDKLNAVSIMDILTNENTTALATTPSLLRNLFIFCDTENMTIDKLKYLFFTSERLTDDIVTKSRRIFPNARIRQNYALTETGVITSQKHEQVINNANSVGEIKNIDAQIKIVNGEIWIKNDNQMLYYIGEDEKRQDGWFPTGDHGYIEDDRLYLLGRKDEIINVGGEKVFAYEVEKVLLMIEWIENAHVYGIKNSITGNVVAADIQTSCEYSMENVKEIRNVCNEYLQKYKRPLVFHFYKQLPMNRNGKIIRK
jgi:acyl-coenzyme A synthetase/AMP-(fatty) acid ligase